MNHFIKLAAPLLLSLLLGLVRVAASLLVSESRRDEVLSSPPSSGTGAYEERRKRALNQLLAELPHGLCLATLSFDTWVMTTLFAAASDPNSKATLALYNIADKQEAILLLMVIHIIFYITVLVWGGSVRGESTQKSPVIENLIGIIAVLLCIVFQWY